MFDIKSDFLTFLKARGSFAQVGNDTDPYRLSNEFAVLWFQWRSGSGFNS